MDETQAIGIVSALANGVNPVTGEMFGPESPYQSPQIVRALFCLLHAVQAKEKIGARKRESLPRNAGRPWTADEDKSLLAAFDSGKSIADLARLHERTAAGIAARLEKHGRIEPQVGALRSRYPDSHKESATSSRQNGR